MKKKIFLIIISFVSPQINTASQLSQRNNTSFSNLWYTVQSSYKKINDEMHAREKVYCTNQWASCKQPLKEYLLQPPKVNFLNFKIPGISWIGHTVFDKLNEYQIVHLQNCIKDSTKKLINNFSDHSLAGYTFNVREFNCSTHTLIHLYYVAQVLEHSPHDIKTIVEIGGGYGNLIRLFKQIKPETTAIMFDISEMCAIQWLYLSITHPDTKIIFHTTAPTDFELGAIHIVPIVFLNDTNINADVFISTFALSESSEYLQKNIIEKKFFETTTIYITGQLEGWINHKGSDYKYVDHSLIHDAVRNQFKHVFCTPYPNATRSAPSYELIAYN